EKRVCINQPLTVLAARRYAARLAASVSTPGGTAALAAAITLLVDLRHHAGADGATAFADGEAQAFFHGDRVDQRDLHLHVVARHHHFHALGQFHRASHVRGTE